MLLLPKIGLVGSVHYVVEAVFETDKPEYGRAFCNSEGDDDDNDTCMPGLLRLLSSCEGCFARSWSTVKCPDLEQPSFAPHQQSQTITSASMGSIFQRDPRANLMLGGGERIQGQDVSWCLGDNPLALTVPMLTPPIFCRE